MFARIITKQIIPSPLNHLQTLNNMETKKKNNEASTHLLQCSTLTH